MGLFFPVKLNTMGYRGRRKSLKRVTAPKSWMLDKLGGNFAPKPSAGPHKSRESLPMAILLRNRLKYALTYDECKKIVMQRLIKVDGKVRTDKTYPCGFMDVITIDRTNEFFRILYDVKGRFVVHRIKAEEAKYKLCRVSKVSVGPKGVPYIVTNDARTVRYPDPLVKVNDTVVLDIASGKMKDFIKFDSGNLVMVTGGHNLATRLSYVFVIGKGSKQWISLPKGKGVRLSIAEERDRRLAAKTQ